MLPFSRFIGSCMVVTLVLALMVVCLGCKSDQATEEPIVAKYQKLKKDYATLVASSDELTHKYSTCRVDYRAIVVERNKVLAELAQLRASCDPTLRGKLGAVNKLYRQRGDEIAAFTRERDRLTGENRALTEKVRLLEERLTACGCL